MTDGFKTYLVSVCAAAVLSVLLPSFIVQQRIKKTAEFAGGVLFLITVLTPFARIDLTDFKQTLSSYLLDASALYAEKSMKADDILSERISGQCEEYILDKADALEMSVDAQVFLNEDPYYPMPNRIIIRGQYTPWQKEQLALVIIQDLNIPEDQQQWEIEWE